MEALSLHDVDSVPETIKRIQDLLGLARQIKQVDTVEPPLPASEFAAGVDRLGATDTKGAQPPLGQQQNVIEIAARQIFQSLLCEAEADDPGFVQVWDLLDILQICEDRGRTESSLLVYLVEELLDSQTTENCKIVFDFLESRRERLIAKDFHKKNLTILRSCNELLRRLSRAEDAVFCGRVFFFLFQTFPLGDKSSVNLRGEFDVENVTTYEQTEPEQAAQPETAEVDAPPPSSDKPTESNQASEPSEAMDGEYRSGLAEPAKLTYMRTDDPTVDNNSLYPMFWRLQQDLSNPVRLFEKANFQTFKEGLATSLAKFRKTPVVVQTKVSEHGGAQGEKEKHGDEHVDRSSSSYNPKYLTSRDLFDLEVMFHNEQPGNMTHNHQLSDLTFQRHILVQALILIDFLLSLTEKAKKRLAELPTVNRSLLYSYTLSDEDRLWATSMRSRIARYLQEGPEGKFYYRMVETVLSRDKNWVRWKIESCPSIVRDSLFTEQLQEAQKGAQKITTNRRLRPVPMGAMDMSFLSETDSPLGLEGLKDPSRHTAPTIESLINEVENDELDLEMATIEEEKQRLKDAISSKTWRALRIARTTRLDALDRWEFGRSLREVFQPEQPAANPDSDSANNE
ncbi:hypothetical protein LTR66_010968 [Elasticomyces elasticus]|nr:hypothetical protein LTR66_010968 [Elasticomyces elasticus]